MSLLSSRRSRFERGLARATLIVVVVVVVIIIAGGAYAAVSLAAKSTSTSVSTVTTTKIVTGSSTVSVTTTASPSTQSSTTSSSSIISTVPFTLCGTSPSAVVGLVPPLIAYTTNSIKNYDPNAYLSFVGSSSSTTVQGLETGLCNMAIIAGNTFVSTVVSGAYNLTEVGVAQAGGQPYFVIVATNSTYTSISQLQTATWINTGPSSQGAFSEENLWASLGWNIANIKQSVTSSSSANVEAVIANEGVSENAVTSAIVPVLSGELRVVYNTSTPFPSNVIVTTPAFAKADPSAVQAAIATISAANTLYNDPSEQAYVTSLYQQTFSTYTAPEIHALLTDAAPWPSNCNMSVSQLQSLINSEFTYGFISKNVSATSLITTGFAPEVP